MKSTLKKSMKFSVTIAVITFVLAAIFSVVSSSVLGDVIWIIGLVIVFVIVFIGILFDTLGIAATAASEAPFHAMAAEKVRGAKQSVVIVRNADKFASFCNDVIGDISGIVSGTASSIVVLQISNLINGGQGSPSYIIFNVILTSVVAALTVGGKAIGKTLAIHSSTSLIFWAGKVVDFIERYTKIPILTKEGSR